MLKLQSGAGGRQTSLNPFMFSTLCLHYIFLWYCAGRSWQSVTPGNLVILMLLIVALTHTNWSFQDKDSTSLFFFLLSYDCTQEDEMFSSLGRAGSFKEATTTLGTGHQGYFCRGPV